MRKISWLYSWPALAIALALFLGLITSSPDAEALPTAPPTGFVAFDGHLRHLHEATHEHYKKLPGAKVAHAAAFNEMKAHLQTLYKDVKVKHSFIGHDGHHVDVIAMENQPSLRHELLKNHKLQRSPPKLHQGPKSAGKKLAYTVEHLTPHLAKGMKDAHGHEMFSPPGSIPMRRLTLAELTRFPTLQDYHRKHGSRSPNPVTDSNVRKPELVDSAGFTHRYAATTQTANNFGGSSWLNLWAPGPASQEFSLSQHWYTGGNPLQTVEGGWQVYPSKYGHNKPVLFIYWTADNYGKTGAYNLEKTGFIQVNHSFVIGGAWNQTSVSGGTQFGFKLIWYRDPGTGNWWMWIKGAGAETAIGYYPRELFGRGQLSQYATNIGYGGEVTGHKDGTGKVYTGMMGSGLGASAGWRNAAFQKDIYYFPTRGNSAWANLSGFADTTKSYSIDVHNEGSSWGSYFFFGGPGHF